MQEIDTIRDKYLQQINNTESLIELEKIRVAALGRHGEIKSLFKYLTVTSLEMRKAYGAACNDLRDEITKALEDKRNKCQQISLKNMISKTKDVTLPTFIGNRGVIHPLSQTIFEIIKIFKDMGFIAVEGPEIEDDYHNFTALNIPLDHPARQQQDTFYLKPVDKLAESLLMRTQTSPVQIRTLTTTKPPIKIIVPGRVFRSDYDATHTPVFHQVEGLYIDKTIHMGHLKGCLIDFCQEFFNVSHLPIRFRPAYFPFTEPSAEVDIKFLRKVSQSQIDDNGEWLEILGSGMVHPNVLNNCGLDPNEWQGFAFGIGIERIAMLKYGISDLRSFYESDIRWLRHYGFSAFSAFMSS